MKINITVKSHSIGLQVFDYYYGYKLHQCKLKNCLEVLYSAHPQPDAVNVLYTRFPLEDETLVDLYDLVLIDNNGEPLEVCDPATKYLVDTYDNVYLMAGAMTVHQKVLGYNFHLTLMQRYHIDAFFPTYHDQSKIKRTDSIYYISGLNRSHRQLLADLLSIQCPSLPQHRESKLPEPTSDSQWETVDDQIFRDSVNDEFYKGKTYPYNDLDHYKTLPLGTQGQCGEFHITYVILPAYYQYRAVIFPESWWTNNQWFPTEKIFKCFVAGCLPLPIGGANTVKYYNHYGFGTAFDLCPEELREFDSELDHRLRYQGAVECIKWLHKHPEVLASESADAIAKNNHTQFWNIKINTQICETLDTLFTQVYNNKV